MMLLAVFGLLVGLVICFQAGDSLEDLVKFNHNLGSYGRWGKHFWGRVVSYLLLLLLGIYLVRSTGGYLFGLIS